MATNPSLLAQLGPDGILHEAPVIAYTEKKIEEEQLQLRKYIQENYTKIRDVEQELTNLSMEMKLTAGPKKAALEHMRKKIELSTERIRVAKLKEEGAKKNLEAASKMVKDEDALKQKLCEDLNNLVQESGNTQLARLEELKRRLEALNPSRSSTSVENAGNPSGPALSIATLDVSVPSSVESPIGSSKSESKQVNGGNIMNGHNQETVADLERTGKKKNVIQGRGKGIPAVAKGRGSVVSGWTGAGFDVDGRL